MKLLQNRLFVGILAALALAMLVNALWPVFTRSSKRSRPKVASVPAPSAPASAPTQSTNASAPVQWSTALAEKLVAATTTTNQRAGSQPQSVNVAALQNDAARWVESPRRDPFQVRRGFGDSSPPAMQLLKLTAVWRQTGGALATINGRVLTEGDPVLKFKIEKIEANGVWVQGPNGRELLEFARPGLTQTNAAAAIPQP